MTTRLRPYAIAALLCAVMAGTAWSNWQPPAAAITVDVATANPELERMASDCLTVAAGPGAIECDDFVYAYELPVLMRMNRPHRMALLNHGRRSYVRPVIGANLTMTDFGVVDSVVARLSINSALAETRVIPASDF